LRAKQGAHGGDVEVDGGRQRRRRRQHSRDVRVRIQHHHTHILQRRHSGRRRQAGHELEDDDGRLPLHLMARVLRGTQQLHRLVVQPLHVALVAHPLLHTYAGATGEQ
jgi:hypothetical protein